MPDALPNGYRLIVGASRGIGLALAEAQLSEPGVSRVVATHRPGSDPRGLQRLAIHPGTTDTALSRPFQRNVRPDKLYAPATTARRILNVLRAAEPAMSGRFLNWDGREIPW